MAELQLHQTDGCGSCSNSHCARHVIPPRCGMSTQRETLPTAAHLQTLPFSFLCMYGNKKWFVEWYFPIPDNSCSNDGTTWNPGNAGRKETFTSAVASFYFLSFFCIVAGKIWIKQMLLLICLLICLRAVNAPFGKRPFMECAWQWCLGSIILEPVLQARPQQGCSDANILSAKISNVASSIMQQHPCNTTLLTMNSRCLRFYPCCAIARGELAGLRFHTDWS